MLLRTLVLLGILGLGAWWTIFLRGRLLEHEHELATKTAEIEQLATTVAEREERIQELDLEIGALQAALELLKVDHRLARVEVLEQTPARGDDPGSTRVRFTELDPEGESLGDPREFSVEGDVLYVEGLVIKFDDSYVEQGDHLRGTSVCLFRRAFGETQKPSEGTKLDTDGLRPLPYAGDDLPDPFYLELWQRFWDYANDPKMAAEKGVRAAHGEAPFIKLRPGKSYRLELRASDGLTIRAE